MRALAVPASVYTDALCRCGWRGPHYELKYYAKSGGQLVSGTYAQARKHCAPCGLPCQLSPAPPKGWPGNAPVHNTMSGCPRCNGRAAGNR